VRPTLPFITAIAGLVLCLLPRVALGEWVVAAYLGGAHTAQSSLQFQVPDESTNLTLHPISYQDKPFAPAIYYGYRGGYFFSRHFGFEGELTHLKVYAETDRVAQISGTLYGAPVNETALASSVVQEFNITHGVNVLTGNFVARKPLGAEASARVVLEARFGAGVTVPHPINEVLGVPNAQAYQIGSPAIQVAGGVDFRLWRRLYAITEAKYTRTNETVNIAHGTATTLLNSVHVIGGLALHFR
jgi:hypothetical protein